MREPSVVKAARNISAVAAKLAMNRELIALLATEHDSIDQRLP